ncbi:MAG: PQQ-dependent sugar dehydrogenase [Candidatus Nanopelagicales bacterium]
MKLMRGPAILANLVGIVLLAIFAGTTTSGAAPRVDRTGVIAKDLTSPWGLTFFSNGKAWVSERDTALIKEIDPSKPAGKNVRTVGKIPGVASQGEGGLLGIALNNARSELYIYYTARTDNRVARIPINGGSLGKPRVIVSGIPKNTYHDGGRILVNRDGTLFIATGDAGEPDRSQNRQSLAGKILHVDRNGKAVGKSRVFSLGHRNVQGLALDSRGQLWASEFGSSEADELNLIIRGKNYGWPICEGACDNPKFENPKAQWSPTSLASPSGIAIVDDTAYVASLRGRVLWQVPLANVDSADPIARKPVAVKLGNFGRLRTVEQAPDGSLWLISSNTDGRGDPAKSDDRIYRLAISN